MSLNQENEASRVGGLVDELKKCEGEMTFCSPAKSIALVRDAGTPIISDPGSILVKACIANRMPLKRESQCRHSGNYDSRSECCSLRAHLQWLLHHALQVLRFHQAIGEGTSAIVSVTVGSDSQSEGDCLHLVHHRPI